MDRVAGMDEFRAIGQRLGAGHHTDHPAPFIQQVNGADIGAAFGGRHCFDDDLAVIIAECLVISRPSSPRNER